MTTQVTKIESIGATVTACEQGNHGVTEHNFMPSIVLGLIDALGINATQNFANRFEAQDYDYCASVLADLCVTTIGFWAFYFFCDESSKRAKHACKAL